MLFPIGTPEDCNQSKIETAAECRPAPAIRNQSIEQIGRNIAHQATAKGQSGNSKMKQPVDISSVIYLQAVHSFGNRPTLFVAQWPQPKTPYGANRKCKISPKNVIGIRAELKSNIFFIFFFHFFAQNEKPRERQRNEISLKRC